jgi:hypothetical protein
MAEALRNGVVVTGWCCRPSSERRFRRVQLYSIKSLSTGSLILGVCHLFPLFFFLTGMMFPLICLIQSHDSVPAMGSRALEITILLFSPFELEIAFYRCCLCLINAIALLRDLPAFASRCRLQCCAAACRPHPPLRWPGAWRHLPQLASQNELARVASRAEPSCVFC